MKGRAGSPSRRQAAKPRGPERGPTLLVAAGLALLCCSCANPNLWIESIWGSHRDPPSAAPSINLNSGIYMVASLSVTIDSPQSGARVFYTTDGSTPTLSSPNGLAPLTVTLSNATQPNVLLQARARLTSESLSPVASAVYYLDQPLTTLVGSGAGVITYTGIWPSGVALGNVGGIELGNGGLYIAAPGLNSICFLDETSNTIRLYTGSGSGAGVSADGMNLNLAQYFSPQSLSLAPNGDLLIVDTMNDRLMRCVGGQVYVWAGGGTDPTVASTSSSEVKLSNPYDCASDAAGNVYIADINMNLIRLRRAGGSVDIVAGTADYIGGYTGDSGPATSAHLNKPAGIWVDPWGSMFLIADRDNNAIRQVDGAGTITTIAGGNGAGFSGDGGAATAAKLSGPTGVNRDLWGNIYIADSGNFRIRKITPDGKISTVAGFGSNAGYTPNSLASAMSCNGFGGLKTDNQGRLYFSLPISNYVLRFP